MRRDQASLVRCDDNIRPLDRQTATLLARVQVPYRRRSPIAPFPAKPEPFVAGVEKGLLQLQRELLVGDMENKLPIGKSRERARRDEVVLFLRAADEQPFALRREFEMSQASDRQLLFLAREPIDEPQIVVVQHHG